MRIFCIIPAYNEKGNLEELTVRLAGVFRKLRTDFHILFVLQGKDSGKNILNRLNGKKEFRNKITYLVFPDALGIGRAYLAGFRNIPEGFTHVLTLDADLNHQPEEFPKFMEELRNKKTSVIIGSRYTEGGNFGDRRIWKRIVSRGTNMFLTNILRIGVRDISSGYRLIERHVIEKVVPYLHESGYPSYMELILEAKKNGYTLSEVPITYIPRKWGTSKMKKITTARDYLRFIPKVLFSQNPH